MIKSLVNLVLIAVLFSACSSGDNNKISSPDRKIELQFSLDQGSPEYKVSFGSEKIISPSKLGFIFKDAGNFTDGLQITSVTERSSDTTWKPVWGTDSEIRDNFSEMTVNLKKQDVEIAIVFRAYNDGIAFRYVFPEQASLQDFNIVSEETAFSFNEDMKSWWTPVNFDTYEMRYKTTLLSKLDSANTPITLQSSKGTVVSIHEAALTDYSDMTLAKDENNALKLNCNLVPWPDGIKVKGSAPFKTPWRTVHIVDNPGGLLESHLTENLNEPSKIDNTSWIKPMKYVGIWWGMHLTTYSFDLGFKHGATTERTIEHIDFAASKGIRGVLVEGWNEGWENYGSTNMTQNYTKAYPDYDIELLAKYAKSKNVELIGHHETLGDIAGYENQLDDALKFLNKYGITSVKTGYAGKIKPFDQHKHGQWMVRHYRKVVEETAKHKIMLNAHEPIKATGIRRTWPNMMTREGVRGMEQNAWNIGGNQPEHTTIIPFTRMVGGPIDYTPGIFKLTWDIGKDTRVHTTLAKQLALYVVLYSPIQMASDLVENYKDRPAFKFIENVPVDWDETKALDCEIGEYVSIARRNGDSWFVGAITDENPRNIPISLSFLEEDKTYLATIYRDVDGKTDYELYPEQIGIENFLVTNSDIINAGLHKSGGIAIQLDIASETDLKNRAYWSDVKKFNSAVSAPYGNYKSNYFIEKLDIALNCDVEGATIYYTTDGSVPSKGSIEYTKPFEISKTTELKYIAFKEGLLPSMVVINNLEKPSYSKFKNYSNLKLKQGLNYKYYEGSVKDVASLDDLPLVESGVVSSFNLDKHKIETFFGFIFSGYLSVPKDGLYTFYDKSNDGSVLYLDGKVLVDMDGAHGSLEKSQTVALKAGNYKIMQKYFQRGGGIEDVVSWEGPGFSKVEIPASALFYE